jgi:hypothetical protein
VLPGVLREGGVARGVRRASEEDPLSRAA